MNEWISVNDRLPEKNGEYIVFVKFNLIPDKVMTIRYENRYEKDKEKSWIIAGLVTHWMPLPEPPKVN